MCLLFTSWCLVTLLASCHTYLIISLLCSTTSCPLSTASIFHNTSSFLSFFPSYFLSPPSCHLITFQPFLPTHSRASSSHRLYNSGGSRSVTTSPSRQGHHTMPVTMPPETNSNRRRGKDMLTLFLPISGQVLFLSPPQYFIALKIS